MAFKASNELPVRGYTRAKQQANSLKSHSDSKAAEFASSQNSNAILGELAYLRGIIVDFNNIKAIVGIAQYAKDQEEDQAYDVVAEFNAMIAATEAVITQITTSFPKDGSGFLLSHTLNGSGVLVPRVFTSGQLTGTVTAFNTLSAAIA